MSGLYRYHAISLATCLAVLLRRKLHARCILSHNQQLVSQYYCCNNHCMKWNQVLLFATIAATLQRIFKALHSVTSLLQLVSQCLASYIGF
jgi:hypothetical protein